MVTLQLQTGGRRPDGTARWKTLSHHGVTLPPPFDRLPRAVGVPALWRGKEVSLKASPEAEFYLSEFVRRGGVTRLPRGGGGGGKFSASLFGSKAAADAFWNDWKALLPSGCPIASLDELDVSRVVTALVAALVTAKKRTIPSPAKGPATNHARVDGKLQPVAPSAVDRPGIFFGRSEDVKASSNGRLRRRIVAEDVTLNLSTNARVPRVPAGCGRKWGSVVHDPTVDWIASWRDPVTDVVKYARLAAASESEQLGTRAKYDLAQKMISATPTLRKKIAVALGSSDRKRRQLGAVLWLVDQLALRIGSGTAASAKRAGAHGVATLAVKHVNIVEGRKNAFRLSFPGKDGVHYERIVDGSDGSEVPSELVRIIADASRSKGPEEALFDAVDSNDAAAAIDSVVPGATAKVIRTARASELFEATLKDERLSTKTSGEAKLTLLFAFARVAILLNHRKAASPGKKKGSLGGGDLAELDRKVDALMSEFRKGGGGTVAPLGKKLREEVVRAAHLSLATARANYIDPRLVFEYGRKVGLEDPGGVTFAKKFPWAANASK